MRRLALFFALLTGATVSAEAARGLDRARALSAKIEAVTRGRIKILNENADDGLYRDPAVVETLNLILNSVLHEPFAYDVSTLTPVRAGWAVIIAIDRLVLGRTHAFGAPLTRADLVEATDRFCRLAAAPCSLFTREISAEICAGVRAVRP